MNRTVLMIGGVGAVAAAAGALALAGRKAAPVTAGPGGGAAAASARARAIQPIPVLAQTAIRRDMRQVLEVSGSLKIDEDVQIGSPAQGRLIEVTVKEGDRARAGQVLARLDDRPLLADIARARARLQAGEAVLSRTRNQATVKDEAARQELERARAALASARTRVQRAETNARLIATETRVNVETAEANLKAAKERLAIIKDATRKQELRQAELEVDQALARLEQAKTDASNARQVFERRRMLFEQDAIAKEEVAEAERFYKAQQTAAEVAEQAVAMAREKLDLAREGTRIEEIKLAEGRTNAAERALVLAKSEERRNVTAEGEVNVAKAAERQAEADLKAAEAGLSQTKISRDQIRDARANIQEARAQIQYYIEQLKDLTIRAPVSGVVSRRLANEGEVVSPGAHLMDLAALDTAYFEARVPEMEVSLLRQGAPCEVIVDAFPDRRFAGTVREIIRVLERSSGTFRVRVALLGDRGKLPVGTSARARINVGTRPSVVAVNRDAVHIEIGGAYVWQVVKDADGSLTARRQPVTLGLMEPRFAEVMSGLREGDQIVTSGSPSITNGSPLVLAEAATADAGS